MMPLVQPAAVSSSRKARAFTIDSLMGRSRDTSPPPAQPHQQLSDDEDEVDVAGREDDERSRADVVRRRERSPSRTPPSPHLGPGDGELSPGMAELPRGFHVPPGGVGFQPVLPGAAAMAALLHAGVKPPGAASFLSNPLMDHPAGFPGASPLEAGHLPAPNGHLHGTLMGLQPGGPHGGLPPHHPHGVPGQGGGVQPMLLGGAHREGFPLYPLLMSRHGGFFGHRFAGKLFSRFLNNT